MKTKLISMLLACIMLVSLAACTNDNDKPGSTPEESTKETDVQTTEDVTTEDETTEPEETGWQGPGKNPNMEECEHSPLYDFNDETMTVGGICKWDSIAQFIKDVASYTFGHFENDEWIPLPHYAVVLDDGVKVTDGSFFKDGMTIQIYHDNELYGEYTTENLLPNNVLSFPLLDIYLSVDEKELTAPPNTLINDFISDKNLANIKVLVFKDGVRVMEGAFEDGMTLQLITDEENLDFTVSVHQ